MTNRERLFAVLNGEQPDRVPIWLLFPYHQLGCYTDVRTNPGYAEIFERSRAKSVFFAGDDLTDFPAIEFAAEHGVGAFVCSEEQQGTPSASAVLLRNVDEVSSLLSQLLQSIAE